MIWPLYTQPNLQLKALKALSSGTYNCNCVIYTDSRSALQALESLAPCQLANSIKQQVSDLTRNGNNITVCWVPGHAGISGNELADHKAKAAVSDLSLISW